MTGIAVIGYGYWGPNLLRNIQTSDDAWVPVVCDQRPERLEAVQKLYPAVQVTPDLEQALAVMMQVVNVCIDGFKIIQFDQKSVLVRYDKLFYRTI